MEKIKKTCDNDCNTCSTENRIFCILYFVKQLVESKNNSSCITPGASAPMTRDIEEKEVTND